MITFVQVVLLIFGVSALGVSYEQFDRSSVGGGVATSVVGIVLLGGAVALEVWLK